MCDEMSKFSPSQQSADELDDALEKILAQLKADSKAIWANFAEGRAKLDAERASSLSRDEDDPDSYLNPFVQSAWEGWKARAALSPRMEAKQASRNSYQPVGKETA